MDEQTIDYVLHCGYIDPISRVHMPTIVFMLYYGLGLKHFLLDISDEYIEKYDIKVHDVGETGETSVYISGSMAQGFYLNTKYLPDARDIDIVSICKKYHIRERCTYDEEPRRGQECGILSTRNQILDVDDDGDRNKMCDIGEAGIFATCEDEKYLNIKVLKDTTPGYVLIEKCRRHRAPVQSMDQRYVSSLKTTETRVDFWREMMPVLRQRFSNEGNRESSLFSFIESHGPAATAYMSLFEGTTPFEIDLVFCIPYPTPWPKVASEWLTRQRPFGWPSQSLIEEIQNDGCTLIPKGQTGSPMEEYEWRISFTGDLKLARSLNRIQREIIHVLKAMVSEPQHSFEMIGIATSVESYHLLNLLYFESEVVDMSQLEGRNIASMSFHLIDKYLEHFQQRTLSHYFIKSRNIFSKYNDLTPEEIDTVLYTLLRIRRDPLGQILQQEKYINLPPTLHKLVFQPLVEAVEPGKQPDHSLYVHTLIRLSKAHLFEGHYKEAYAYALDAASFYRKMRNDEFSQLLFSDLFVTVSVCSHRNGEFDNALDALKKLHTFITTAGKEECIQLFGRDVFSHLLALYGRILLTSIKNEDVQVSDFDTVKNKAKTFYEMANEIDPNNLDIAVEQIYVYFRVFGYKEYEKLVSELRITFPEFDPLYNDIISNTNDIEDIEVVYDRKKLEAQRQFEKNEDKKRKFSDLDETLLSKTQRQKDTPEDSFCETLETAVLNEFESSFFEKTDILLQTNFQTGMQEAVGSVFSEQSESSLENILNTVPLSTAEKVTLETFGTVLPPQEAYETSFLGILETPFPENLEPPFSNSFETPLPDMFETPIQDTFETQGSLEKALPELIDIPMPKTLEIIEQSTPIEMSTEQESSTPISLFERQSNERSVDDLQEDEFTIADVNMLNIEFIQDFCRIKAFTKIGLHDKVDAITLRLNQKILKAKSEGQKVNMKMLEYAYDMFYPAKEDEHSKSSSIFDNIFSNDDGYVVFTLSEKSIFDDILQKTFAFKHAPQLKLPVAISILHIQIQYLKYVDKFEEAYKLVMKLKLTIEEDLPVYDTYVCRYLLGCHLNWFGKVNAADIAFKNSQDKTAKVPVREQVMHWMEQVFEVVTKIEPKNKYLDEIFTA